jgi:large exoprotein involved in heme utilization and adhesion
LNIGGSFLGSTADSLLFPEGEFSATNLQTPPLLTINAPIGLNLRDNPSPISNNSQTGLQVQSGKNVSLVGGDVSLDGGGITAPGGRIELGGLTAAGTVGINNDSSLSFPDSVARSNVSLTNGAFVDVIGEGGGFITVNANNLEILDGSGLLAGIRAGVGSIGAQAGDITLNATDKITIQGDANSGLSAIGNVVLPIAKGNAGDISIKGRSLSLTNGAQLSSSTFGEGNAGNVTIAADGAVNLVGGNIFSNVENQAVGNGGKITITAGELSLKDGAQLQTLVRAADTEQNLAAGRGEAGNIDINVGGAVTLAGKEGEDGSAIFSSLGTGAEGKAGDINIKAGSLSLADEAVAIVSSTSGKGNAGNVTIAADGAVNLVGGNIFSNVENQAVGNGGKITITAGELSLKDGAQLQTLVRAADTEQNLAAGRGEAGNIDINVGGAVTLAGKEGEGGSAIFSSLGTGAEGKAGDITIQAGSLSLADEAVSIDSSTSGQGNAGNVTIAADGAVNLVGGDIFSNVENQAVGNGGKITITAGELSLKDRAQVNASTLGQGNAGNISINVTDKLRIQGEANSTSQIRSDVDFGAIGNAGNLFINTGNLEGIGDFLISASSLGTGKAGDISITATNDVFLQGLGTANGVSTLTSDFVSEEPSGNISISGKSISLDNSLVLASTIGGNAGNVQLNGTDGISLQNGSQIQAIVVGAGKAGSIILEAPNGIISFDSKSLLATASIAAPDIFEGENKAGQSGNISIKARSLSLKNESGFLTSNLFFPPDNFSEQDLISQGNSGNIDINVADSVSFSGNSNIFTNIFGFGNAGNVTINAGRQINLDGSRVSSTLGNFGRNLGSGKGGNITIATQDLNLTNGARLETTSSGRGDAGNININATNSVSLNGGTNRLSTGLFSNLDPTGIGKAGDIQITTKSLSLNNGAAVKVDSLGQGNGGNLFVQTNSLSLDKGSSISAATITGEGGNINLKAKDVLRLRDNSTISAQASNPSC